MTLEEHCCYRLIRLMASPKKYVYLDTIKGCRDADGIPLTRHLAGIEASGAIQIKYDQIFFLK